MQRESTHTAYRLNWWKAKSNSDLLLTEEREDSNPDWPLSSSDATLNVTQYLVHQLAYTGHLLNIEQKLCEKGKLWFSTALEKKNWSHVEYIGKKLGVRRAYNIKVRFGKPH